MSVGMAFTALEDGLFGPDGAQVLRQTAGRLIGLRNHVSEQERQGLTTKDAATAAMTLTAISAAERIIIDFTSSGE